MSDKIKIEKKAPKYLSKSDRGGLFIGLIYVLAFMSILLLGVWQKFADDQNKSSMTLVDERLSLIEEQISMFDETNNDSMTDITSSIQLHDKEIRKLWDLSNKRNKVNIQKITKQIDDINNVIENLEKELVENNKKILESKKIIRENITKISDISASLPDNVSIRSEMNSINTQLMLLDDSMQALNNYRAQLNQTMLEIQTELTNIQINQQPEKIEN
tara:strand:+ start:9141 stop:9791 length:651 start_codon:yes stop_codon:yes gene_type:complete